MSTIQLNIVDGLATVTLDRGRSNPINHQLIKDLTACIQDFEHNKEVSAVVITGKDGFFSSGIDLIEAYSYNEEQIRAFWVDFLQMQVALASFSKPLVAAITGHSPAGGCVIAICCDYRVMGEGQYIIGLNEIPVGIIVPDSVFNLYAFWLDQHKAYQYLMEGKLLSPADALANGLVDEVVPAQDVLAQAEAKAHAYMKLNNFTWSQSKLNLRRELINKLNADQSATLDVMLKQWWAPATRKGLEMMIQQLTAKK
ncbi:enoyl-CoA hydratase/isomerase family protein [Mucilaginibacter myungsuensis]|uniref:Enoyl-CoA hydratase/isomerase family protein n=1 Tax=Mucilaginibacter myungsuensis TaxID=649104 RepID=A0A929PV62_9SPHI|nr:enoyl-CoA hydratase/isomerase family protein [Mucilaginibacter myungsuensis]MBE9660666.1 enoyl-CoA hydratase/isomerase family protein [Mucilaginibacter myungsuensis]MDN3600711.1 enoyl-CoA hydratase/isomerase family protein [Mucilaginibacter myungsuensis]